LQPNKTTAGSSIVAAVFNTSPDIVDMMRRAFEPAGIVTVTALTHQIREGAVNVDTFLQQHNPAVVVYDIAPPYDANWKLFEHIRSMPTMRERPIVITSANARRVEELVGRDEKVYEVVGKPLDLDQIVRAVKEASKSRPVR
jgi:CheY-like chemotaxis protein